MTITSTHGHLAPAPPPSPGLWIRACARVGYVAAGVLWVTIGGLGVAADWGLGDREASSSGALNAIARRPAGKGLVLLLAVGLLAFAIWQFVRAVKDADGWGRGFKGWVLRAGCLLSGAAYLCIIYATLRTYPRWFDADPTGDQQARDWTARLMSYPLGRWVVAALGVGFVAFGATEAARAMAGRFDRWLFLNELSARLRPWARGISAAGLVGHGVVFATIGGFFLRAAWTASPHKARGLGGALRGLGQTWYGRWVLGAAALGLIAYGAYNFLLARYRYIRQT